MVDKMGTGARGRLHAPRDSRRSRCKCQPVLFSVAAQCMGGGVRTCFTVVSGKL